jgi:hypothetical protein
MVDMDFNNSLIGGGTLVKGFSGNKICSKI